MSRSHVHGGPRIARMTRINHLPSYPCHPCNPWLFCVFCLRPKAALGVSLLSVPTCQHVRLPAQHDRCKLNEDSKSCIQTSRISPMNRFHSSVAASIAILIAFSNGLSTHADETPRNSFGDQVQPVLRKYCIDCHT